MSIEYSVAGGLRINQCKEWYPKILGVVRGSEVESLLSLAEIERERNREFANAKC